jgi:hypothetical protein
MLQLCIIAIFPLMDTLRHADNLHAVNSFALYFPHVPLWPPPATRVYYTFFSRKGWPVQFCEADLRTPLAKTLTFADPEKIRELARRGEALGTSEAKQMLEYAIEVGEVGLYLRLTPGQYAQLRRS